MTYFDVFVYLFALSGHQLFYFLNSFENPACMYLAFGLGHLNIKTSVHVHHFATIHLLQVNT